MFVTVVGVRAAGRAFRLAEVQAAGGEQEHEFGEHHAADEHAHGRVLDEARPQFGEIDIQHHDDEEEEHRHRAHVDDDEQHGDELGAEQDEEAAALKNVRIRNSTAWTGSWPR